MTLKQLKSFIYVLLTCIILSNCERDDICSDITEKTPKLRIEFRDLSNRENAKAIPKLRVTAVDNAKVLATTSQSPSTLYLPLRATANSTRFILHKDYAIDDNDTPDDIKDDIILGDQDTISIHYTLVNQYISRACGFRTVYDNVTVAITKDDKNWMRLVKPVEENQTIENEKDAHFYIYH